MEIDGFIGLHFYSYIGLVMKIIIDLSLLIRRERTGIQNHLYLFYLYRDLSLVNKKNRHISLPFYNSYENYQSYQSLRRVFERIGVKNCINISTKIFSVAEAFFKQTLKYAYIFLIMCLLGCINIFFNIYLNCFFEGAYER